VCEPPCIEPRVHFVGRSNPVSCGYGEPVGGNTEVFGPSVIIRMEAEAWGDFIDNYLRAASHLLDHGGFQETGFL
jgi:hypothetical protein